jgi:hypothetical protein
LLAAIAGTISSDMRHAMPLDTVNLVQCAFFALLFGLLGWAAFGSALSGLMG